MQESRENMIKTVLNGRKYYIYNGILLVRDVELGDMLFKEHAAIWMHEIYKSSKSTFKASGECVEIHLQQTTHRFFTVPAGAIRVCKLTGNVETACDVVENLVRDSVLYHAEKIAHSKAFREKTAGGVS